MLPGGFLGDQAAYARRGGLSFDAALAAVTITPARMVGIDDRVGTVEVGKDGDLALWNGTPFELSSKVVGVVLNGELVIDPR
jgi:imidazolonepropionase-like amidohydrolase